MKIQVFLAVVAASASLACGPVWMIPGGALSGESRPVPADWSVAEGEKIVQLEVRPADPYSVNVWGAGMDESFYVAAGRGGESEWATAMLEDPNVRLRVADSVYALRAEKVDDEDEKSRFLAVLAEKYDFAPDPEDKSKAWLFRLGARQP